MAFNEKGFFVILLLSIFAFSCAKTEVEYKSNLAISEEQAQKDVASRLARIAEVRAILDVSREIFSSAGNFLTKASQSARELGFEGDADNFTFACHAFSAVLAETMGRVFEVSEKREDWSLDVQLNSLGSIPVCGGMMRQTLDQSEKKEMVFEVADCRTRLLSQVWNLKNQGKMWTGKFFPTLREEEYCDLSIEGSAGALKCRKAVFNFPERFLKLRRLEFESREGNQVGSIVFLPLMEKNILIDARWGKGGLVSFRKCLAESEDQDECP